MKSGVVEIINGVRACPRRAQAPLNFFTMSICKVAGLGLAIIMCQLLVPRVFKSVEDTILASLNTAQVLMSVSARAVVNGAFPTPLAH